MDIKTMKEVLPFFFKADVTPFFWGAQGVGKTQGIKQFAKKANYRLVELRLGQMDAGDIIGLPNTNTKTGKTDHYPPSWWPTAEDDSKGIVFLDEINRGSRDVLQAVFQLVNERRLYEHVLPEGWHVIAAANPNTEGFIVADIDDAAFMDRFCHIRIKSTSTEWIDFAEESEFHNDVVNYIKTCPSSLGNNYIEFPKFDEDVTPSPRSWDAINRLLKSELPQKYFMELSFGLVGTACTTQLLESMNDFEKPIPASDVLTSFPKIKKRLEGYSKVTNGEASRADLVNVTASDLTKILIKKGDAKLTPEEIANVILFAKAIPKDMAYQFLRDLSKLPNWLDNLTTDKSIITLVKQANGSAS